MPRGKKKVSVAKAATTGKKGAKFSSGNYFKLESPEKDSRNVMWFCGQFLNSLSEPICSFASFIKILHLFLLVQLLDTKLRFDTSFESVY